MTTYKTPGVYIDEINSLPPSVAAVSTAIPAFIGRTKNVNHPETGASLVNEPIRITSLLEYTTIYGISNEAFEYSGTLNLVDDKVASITVTTVKAPSLSGTDKPKTLLYYSLQMYFANGGGPCYIVSIGSESTAISAASGQPIDNAINRLKDFDEPTLVLCPDACLDDTATAGISDLILAHCLFMKDRFGILDVPKAYIGGTDDAAKVTTYIGNVGTTPEKRMYGAAYYPFLKTDLNYAYDSSSLTSVKITLLTVTKTYTNGQIVPNATVTNVALDDTAIKTTYNAFYNAVLDVLKSYKILMPPSGAMAGVYAATDRVRNVWQSPANVGLTLVNAPSLKITTDFNDTLNSPPSGRAVNAIRYFTGKGTIVWGGRTLNANDLNWRFINVRREVIFIEESIQKALEDFIFEPNTANTWTRAKAMVENFLSLIWRQGGLAGAKPEDAFEVHCGLNSTMTPADVAAGIMIMSIVLVPPRPAEVIVLRVSQKLQVS